MVKVEPEAKVEESVLAVIAFMATVLRHKPTFALTKVDATVELLREILVLLVVAFE